jgi:hypothetical protein
MVSSKSSQPIEINYFITKMNQGEVVREITGGGWRE